MYGSILVPLDGSKRAEQILPHVEALATRFRAKVVFLQVVEPFFLDTELPETAMGISLGLMQQKAAEGATYLAGYQGEFREMGIEAVARVESGPVVETILRVAEREGSRCQTRLNSQGCCVPSYQR